MNTSKIAVLRVTFYHHNDDPLKMVEYAVEEHATFYRLPIEIGDDVSYIECEIIDLPPNRWPLAHKDEYSTRDARPGDEIVGYVELVDVNEASRKYGRTISINIRI